jgi:hypothetical protein
MAATDKAFTGFIPEAYDQGTPLRSEIVARDPAGLEQATLHACEALAQRLGDGPVGKSQAVVFTATR